HPDPGRGDARRPPRPVHGGRACQAPAGRRPLRGRGRARGPRRSRPVGARGGSGRRPQRRSERSETVKYMLLIYGDQERWESLGADELAAVIRETDALNRALLESGELVGAY